MMQDTTQVTQVVTDTVGPVATVLIGVAASAATGLIRSGTQAVDRVLGNTDRTVTHALGPVWPIVVTGLSMALPLLSNVLHVTNLPDAAVIATAPVSAVVGIALRELVKRVPFFGGAK